MALCTLSDVKLLLGIQSIDTNEDDLISTLIDNVSSMFETYCGRTFTSTTYTEYYDGLGGDKLYTNQYPIVSVSGIYDDSSWAYGVDTLIDSSYYRISTNGLSVNLVPGQIFSEGSGNIKIIYTAGYTTIPLDLKQACIDEVARKYKRRDRIDVTAISLGNESISMFSDDFLPTTKIVLNSYRRISIC